MIHSNLKIFLYLHFDFSLLKKSGIKGRQISTLWGFQIWAQRFSLILGYFMFLISSLLGSSLLPILSTSHMGNKTKRLIEEETFKLIYFFFWRKENIKPKKKKEFLHL